MTDMIAMTECWKCCNRRNIPGDTHIQCADPDPQMEGSEHGIKQGWFFYPINFDPVWKTRRCRHYNRGEFERIAELSELVQIVWHLDAGDRSRWRGLAEALDNCMDFYKKSPVCDDLEFLCQMARYRAEHEEEADEVSD